MWQTINDGINHIENEYNMATQFVIFVASIVSIVVIFVLSLMATICFIQWQIGTPEQINQFMRALLLSTIPIPTYLYYVGIKLNKETK